MCAVASMWRLIEGIGSLPRPCGFLGFNTGYQDWQQVPLPSEPSC